MLRRQLAGEGGFSLEEMLQRVGEREGDELTTALAQAQLAIRANQPEVGRSYLEQAQQLDPDHPQVRLMAIDLR